MLFAKDTCNYYEHYTNFKTDVKNKHKQKVLYVQCSYAHNVWG